MNSLASNNIPVQMFKNILTMKLFLVQLYYDLSWHIKRYPIV